MDLDTGYTKLILLSNAVGDLTFTSDSTKAYILVPDASGASVPVLLDDQRDQDGRVRGTLIASGELLLGESGEPRWLTPEELTPADTTSRLRRSIRSVLDLHAIGNPNPHMRRDAVVKVGQQQNPEYLPFLQAQLETESDRRVQRALREALALTRVLDADPAVRVESIRSLTTLRSIHALDFIKGMQRDALAAPDRFDRETQQALNLAVRRLENYIWRGNLVGTAFRGLSLAAVLLVAALGLAITFGLMGIINMAHGEMMLVGAYATYLTQNVFLWWFGPDSAGLEFYLAAAMAVSFVVAALTGLVLERGVIRFLYRRPLESLLATWGVSLMLQQLFRHLFGAANVQVDAPAWISGSLVIQDVLFAYNRLFIIGFALFVVVATWLLLTRTSWGLQIRAVMQNRTMASCMGVRTDRVNAMTFAFGSGLAGLAGACLSQIANVGPGLGQSYIIDCFMIVVLGGVGNLMGTGSAALGVGLTNQILEPWLGAVLGKITVLVAIILFLQWRPAGLFASRSRALEG